MLTRLRNSIAVGRMFVSPSDITGNSSGKPPASHTPRLTYSAIWRKWATSSSAPSNTRRRRSRAMFLERLGCKVTVVPVDGQGLV